MIEAIIPQFIITALWQGLIVAAAAWLAARLIRAQDAAARSLVWQLAFMFALLLPFAIFLPEAQLRGPVMQDVTAGGLRVIVDPVTQMTGSIGEPTGVDKASFPVPGAIWLVLAWLTGSAWHLARLFAGMSQLRQIASESVPVDHGGLGLFSHDIRVHHRLESPLTTGIVRPVIILPRILLLSGRERLEAVLAHERAHIERKDLFASFAESLALCIFWWNPFLHLIRRAIQENREMACDDRAVAVSPSAGSYAFALVKCAENILANRQHASIPHPALGAYGKSSVLTRRVSRLTDQEKRASHWNGIGLRTAFIGLTLAAAIAATAAPRAAIAGDSLTPAINQAVPTAQASLSGQELVRAVIENDMARAKLLVAGGADINAVLELDGTPLIAAVNEGHLKMARWLIDQGADVDAYARYDETALISASRHGRIQAVRLLVDAGADVNLSAPTEDGVMRSPLGEARRGGSEDIAALLIAAGANN